MRRVLTLLPLVFPATAPAQEGTAAYDLVVEHGFEVPEGLGEYGELIPTRSTTSVILLFNPKESVTLSAPPAEEDELTREELQARRIAQWLRRGSKSRSDHETLLATYAGLEDGTIIETREFMGRSFLIRGARPSYEWKLMAEQGEFLGYTVQKATTTRDSSAIEAWFASEIPVSAGPAQYGGLPGLILVVSVDEGHTIYSATEVDMAELQGGAIEAPEEGHEVSRDEYEEIVAEKMTELETERSRRRRR
jgi:GLPGLI family protein